MKSPGGMNLKGSGEVIYEIRQLIKDFWFNNELEKKEKEIELKIKKFEYTQKFKY